MRDTHRALLITLCLLGLAGCGGRVAQGDAALARGAHRDAAAQYLFELRDRGLSPELRRRWARRPDQARHDPELKGKLSPQEEDALKEKLRAAMAGVWAPTMKEAEALFADGFSVLALQLVAPLCEPGGQFTLESEVVPGSCALVQQIVARLELEASGGERASFTRSAQLRGAVAQAFPSIPPAGLAKALRADVFKNARQALKEGFPTHAWAWLRGYTLGRHLEPSEKSGRFDVQKRHRAGEDKRLKTFFNKVVTAAGQDQQQRSKAAQGAQPWLAQVHAGVADLVSPLSQSRRYGSLPGGVSLVAGSVSGPCADEARRALGREDAGIPVRLDLQIEACQRAERSRSRPRQKTEAYTVSSGGWVRDPIQRFETQQVCERVKVCRQPKAVERYWLPWTVCNEKDVEFERRCKDVQVRAGTDWGPRRQVTSTTTKYRTVTVQEAYPIHVWTLKAQVTAHVGDRTLRYRIDVSREGSDARTLGFAGWTDVLNQLAAGDGKLIELLAGRAPADPVDALAARLVRGETLDAEGFERLAEAARAPVWVLAAAFGAQAHDPAVNLHAFALAEVEPTTDWSARWADVPPVPEGRQRDHDPLETAPGQAPTLLQALRQLELDQLADVRWRAVLHSRHWPDLSVPSAG